MYAVAYSPYAVPNYACNRVSTRGVQGLHSVESEPGRLKMARKVIYIAGAVVVVLLVVAILLPLVIDANRFRPEIESSLNSALNRKVNIGNIRLAILSGGVTVENIAISDDPAFNTGPFLKAKSLSVNLE